jgi:hypothetical protein
MIKNKSSFLEVGGLGVSYIEYLCDYNFPIYIAFTEKVESSCNFPALSRNCYKKKKVSSLHCFYAVILDLYQENLVALGSELCSWGVTVVFNFISVCTINVTCKSSEINNEVKSSVMWSCYLCTYVGILLF